MIDMSVAIVPKSDQISADDLIAGPMTVTITGVKIRPDQEQKVDISVAESDRVYRPCKIMSRVLVAAWGPDANAYAGRSLTLYRDPSVKWGGMAVGGIRISHMSHIDKELTLMLTMTKQNRAPHKVRVLDAPRAAPATDYAALARAMAGKGTDAFRAWFKANPDARPAANAIMDELKQIAAAADAAMEADPFGLPPAADPTPTFDADAIAAEARAATDQLALEDRE